MQLFPIALQLQGRRCVVVGGGEVGARKARALLECSAHVVVVSPELHESLHQYVENNAIEYIAEPFAKHHLVGAFLCVVATSNREVNAEVIEVARDSNILANAAAPVSGNDMDGESGDFVTMATVRRGDLLLAITTGGAGPSLSAQLRRELETQFGAEWSEYTALLREMRQLLKQRAYSGSKLMTTMRKLVENDAVRIALTQGNKEEARLLALATITSPLTTGEIS